MSSSYRLDVISASVADAVRYAGGLMFDRGRAGWRVVVVTQDATDSTALTILGTCTQSPGQIDEPLVRPGRVIHIRILSGDALPVNRHAAPVGTPQAPAGSRLLFWGPQASGKPTGPVHPVRHELSAAARKFKAHALHAVGLDTEVGPSEEFWASDVLDLDLLVDLLHEPQIHASKSHARLSSQNLVGG